jgi:hypothetical protein
MPRALKAALALSQLAISWGVAAAVLENEPEETGTLTVPASTEPPFAWM